MPAVLLTRPEPDSRRLAVLLPGLAVLIAPIIRIVPVDHDAAVLAQAGGVVFTSAHAVPFAGEGGGRLALCVGGRTAEVARAAGFDVKQGDGSAAGLIPLIEAAKVALIHPHGRHLAQRLPVPGIVVYDQQIQPLSAQALDLLAQPGTVILPLLSARSADLLAKATAGSVARLLPVAISPAVAERWRGRDPVAAVAGNPTLPDMATQIRHLASLEPSPMRRVEQRGPPD